MSDIIRPSEFGNEEGLTPVEDIVPGIKPPLPLEPRELYRPIRSADYSADVRNALVESPELKEFFGPFAGQVLVDIGPGEMPTGYQIAALSGAGAYVGVEPYASVNNLKEFLKIIGKYAPSTRLIPRTAIQADALSFLKRLPDKSVSIFASQMESIMEAHYQKATERDCKSLASQRRIHTI